MEGNQLTLFDNVTFSLVVDADGNVYIRMGDSFRVDSNDVVEFLDALSRWGLLDDIKRLFTSVKS